MAQVPESAGQASCSSATGVMKGIKSSEDQHACGQGTSAKTTRQEANSPPSTHSAKKRPNGESAESEGGQMQSTGQKASASNGCRGRSPLMNKAMSKSVSSKAKEDLLTTTAIPRGYLDYWSDRLDEAVADIEDSEEFDLAYKKQEQRLFPFRTSSTEWTINGALGK
ncbi:phosphatidylcholine transfer [Cyclospora cayetanensis]|uniref:Phosphatidylcholine transfer n=1 Tax=Cyclospora cayetanensis TaxID=88456 RepID=A0A1D3D523_9EIME|nr:phosphatidylcholine transfer [Cyclospora cayetanensis]